MLDGKQIGAVISVTLFHIFHVLGVHFFVDERAFTGAKHVISSFCLYICTRIIDLNLAQDTPRRGQTCLTLKSPN